VRAILGPSPRRFVIVERIGGSVGSEGSVGGFGGVVVGFVGFVGVVGFEEPGGVGATTVGEVAVPAGWVVVVVAPATVGGATTGPFPAAVEPGVVTLDVTGAVLAAEARLEERPPPPPPQPARVAAKRSPIVSVMRFMCVLRVSGGR
jgi:hypothetical protein